MTTTPRLLRTLLNTILRICSALFMKLCGIAMMFYAIYYATAKAIHVIDYANEKRFEADIEDTI